MSRMREKKYVAKLERAKIFDNTYREKIPQTAIAKICEAHAGKGKNCKVLLIAFDAVRPDALLNIVTSSDREKYPYSENVPGSGIGLIKQEGGLYFCYTGGDPNRKETWQESSTIPGFATILSGKWCTEHHVRTNNDGFEFCADTFLLNCARAGKRVSFNAAWDAFFDCLFKKEKDLQLENYSFQKSTKDCETFDNIKQSILRGDEVIFGIFENPDNNGHRYIFRNQNHAYVKAVIDSDRYAYAPIETARQNFPEDDWLFMIVTDHGGHMYRHGTRRPEDLITFIASNKKISGVGKC